ncbi:unnamed protein product [Rotaria sp. Silwood2]|nr:unnamed protein product [Rotaria sp. Silwood2]
MKNPSILVSNKQTTSIGETIRISMIEQADNTQMKLLPFSPIIQMKWTIQSEQTQLLIKKMINDMLNSSSFKNITKTTDDDVCLKSIYNYAQALRVSQTQNMSSTEITAAQLSLIPLNSGDRVLFLGAKGGYIQTIAAQIVGFQGQVWICSQDSRDLQHVENVLKNHVSTILREIIKCVLVSNIQDVNQVKNRLEQHFKSTEQYFNTIHVCGAISQDSLEYFQQFLKVEGQLLAPINIDENNQKFTILHKIRDQNSGQVTLNKRILHDWGIIFGPVL